MMPTMMPPKAGRATWLLHVAGGSVAWEATPSL
jgi:lipopolysaccharide export system protein LptC